MKTPTDDAKLLPCPFCAQSLMPNNNQDDLYVRRYGTHYQHPRGDCHLSDHEVSPSEIAAWNRRAALQAPPADVMRALEALEAKNTPSTIRLIAGEMTAQEMRTARAVLTWAISSLRAALAAPTQPSPAPVECETEGEKRAFAFGWWKALEANRLAAPTQAPAAADAIGLTADLRASLRHFISAGMLIALGDYKEAPGYTKRDHIARKALEAFDEWFALQDSRTATPRVDVREALDSEELCRLADAIDPPQLCEVPAETRARIASVLRDLAAPIQAVASTSPARPNVAGCPFCGRRDDGDYCAGCPTAAPQPASTSPAEADAALRDVADAVCKQFTAAGIEAVIGSPNPAEDLHARAVLALGGTVKREHITSSACWCGPTVEYTDPETNVSVLVHKELQ